jgi:hypothetical protein
MIEGQWMVLKHLLIEARVLCGWGIHGPEELAGR